MKFRNNTKLTLQSPVIGSFVTVRKSWRWTQWTIIFFAIFSLILTLFASETYKKTLLTRRAKRLNLPPPPSPLPPGTSKIWFLLTITLFRPIHMLFTEPIVAFLGIYVSFNFAVLFAFFAAFPLVFGEVYHFSVETSGLVFLAVGVGNLLSIPTVFICDWYLYQPHVRKSKEEGRGGVVAPEHRLYPAMMGSVGLPIGLFVSCSFFLFISISTPERPWKLTHHSGSHGLPAAPSTGPLLSWQPSLLHGAIYASSSPQQITLSTPTKLSMAPAPSPQTASRGTLSVRSSHSLQFRCIAIWARRGRLVFWRL